ncbi:autophagy-related protein 9 [Amborella trichopoda]|uniref:Autophagy-related protein 9 n=1 Tax=Amborella trichopoda TaxID=13333 RepID=W1NHD7_AMBTC|nr:autophagy-related protein 9 [Amborella trichopoda]ERM94913.1 hypothetical protein AMTR_s00009p00170950 [Amborella trichopoda]|eukprot:XP_006827497.3 autophagy-related protein 9 [Amborella trichopoda]
MSGEQKGANYFGRFKWRRHGESSMTERLLHDVPPEIELSDYQRLSDADSESPSGLLNGESLKAEPIADLDLFFERLYNYYCEKGLWCIITKWIVELLSVGFTIFFSGFFLLYVDWHSLSKVKCGIEAVQSGKQQCDLFNEALFKHPLVPFTFSRAIIVGYLGISSIYWVFCFLRFFAQLRNTLEIRDFYYKSLKVTDNEIQTTPWAVILDKVVELQSSQQLCVVKDLSAHDMVMRIMRKENYLIGMLNKGVLALPIPSWIPGAGPLVKSQGNGGDNYMILTEIFEWSLNCCILQSMFDRNFTIRRDFISNPDSLKKRLMVVGLGIFLISPFLIIFMLVKFFLRHAEEFYKHPRTVSTRTWSNLSKWILREYNEVDHLFKHRINAGFEQSAEYIKQFPSPIVSLIAKFVSFVAGGFAAVLIIVALLDESLLEAHVYGRNLFWFTVFFGSVTAISRSLVADEYQVFDPEGAMSLVSQHTHYMPKKWRGKEYTDKVRGEFEALYQYIMKKLLEDMVSIFLTPYLLIFLVPKCVDDILKFISDFTVDVEGVGHVCSFTLFDFEKHGNSKYGSPFHAPREWRSSQGKMEKSFLSFKSSYPSWVPSPQGNQLLSTLEDFRHQMIETQIQALHLSLHGRPSITFSRIHGGVPWESNLRRWALPMSGLPLPMGHMTSPWMMAIDQRDHHCLLDYYYKSRSTSSCAMKEPKYTPPPETSDLPNETRLHIGMPYDHIHHEMGHNEKWGFSSEDRVESHMAASTSTAFRDSMLRQQETSQLGIHGETPWWARPCRKYSGAENSFLEPLSFVDHGISTQCDNISVRSEDEVQNVGSPLRRLRAYPGFRAHDSFLDPPSFTGRGISNQCHNLSAMREEEFQNVGSPPKMSRIQTDVRVHNSFHDSSSILDMSMSISHNGLLGRRGEGVEDGQLRFGSSNEVGRAYYAQDEREKFARSHLPYNNVYRDAEYEREREDGPHSFKNVYGRSLDEREKDGAFHLPFNDIYSNRTEERERNEGFHLPFKDVYRNPLDISEVRSKDSMEDGLC